MTISVDICGRDAFKIKVHKGPNFSEERDRIKQIQGKKPIWSIDPTTAKCTFQHWEVPRSGIGKLYELFDRNSIIVEPGASSIFNRFDSLTTPIDELPRIEGEINWYRAPLYQCQEDYIRVNRDRNRLVCAFAVGVGKSYSSLTRASVLGFHQLVIVCPTTLLTNWRSEVFKHLGLPSFEYHGTIKQRAKLIDKVVYEPIVVTSYSMIHELMCLSPQQIIFDEAHLLAHATTKTYDRAHRFVKSLEDSGIQLLTGTPILHKPKDLWAPTNLIYPELAGDYREWEDRYEEVIKYFKKKIYAKDADGHVMVNPAGFPIVRFEKQIPLVTRTRNLDELHERTRRFMVRVKQDGLVNFENQVEIIKVRMPERQKRLYKRIAKDVLLQLESKDINITTALSEMTRCLQVAEGCFNLEPKWLDSGKVDFIREYINLYPNDKIIIWSRFKFITEYLHSLYKNESVVFNGDRSKNQKQLAIWSFQGVENDFEEQRFQELVEASKWKLDPGEARLFFATIDKVSSLGFNLHACYRQIFPSFLYNGNVNEQAAGRIKRPGQQADEVFTTILCSEGTIDDEVLAMTFENVKNCHHVLDGQSDVTYNQMTRLINRLKETAA